MSQRRNTRTLGYVCVLVAASLFAFPWIHDKLRGEDKTKDYWGVYTAVVMFSLAGAVALDNGDER